LRAPSGARFVVIGLLLSCAAAAQAQDAAELLRRADAATDRKTVVGLLTRAIAADPTLAIAYYRRGRARFKLADARGSVADFDRYIARVPAHASRQWERGISLYYAGRFADGAKQFAHSRSITTTTWRARSGAMSAWRPASAWRRHAPP
jgi:lipoprotein NlpI